MKISLQLFGGRGASSFKIRTVHGYTTKIHTGRQQKHIEGSNNYIDGRSKLTISQNKAQELINKYAGKGEKINNYKERVDFGEIIGKWHDTNKNKYYDTSNGTIIYSKDGTHLVPSRPN